MTYLTHSLVFFFFSFLSLLLCVSIAGSRPVHGPAYPNPSALSPEAYDFFHPKSSLSHNNPPKHSPSSPSISPSLSPSKTSNNVEADSQGGSKVSSDEHTKSESSRREQGRGETIGVVLGVSIVAFLSLGIYFVIKKRHANIIRTIVIHSDA
ncbi:hypothetical protein V5N11_008100 [Cardamine amara subsp. amara]|uniref:Transmembrane protein n=1 Tax=Cardamine amara subsp. amara TaxID=228776 RepID=A0ABD1APP4_CARAN